MYKFVSDLESEVLQRIQEQDFDVALNLICDFVTDVLRSELSLANVFGSKCLDNLCERIGLEVWRSEQKVQEGEGRVDRNLDVFVATELYREGGHTAVIEQIIGAQPERNHKILLTDIFRRADYQSICERFAGLRVSIECAPKTTLLDKLKWLRGRLVSLGPSRTFLFNHHQDAVAIAVTQPKLNSEVIFYHHADHQLCLGVFLTSVVHVDPHNLGFFNCRNKLGIDHNIYWPLAFKDSGPRPSSLLFLSEGMLRTCSSGNSGKFERHYRYSYPEEVPNLLKVTGGVHIHVGALSSRAMQVIHDGLEKRGIAKERFVLIPWVQSLWHTIIEQRVDLYISSFPLGGGLAGVEVMGSATPMVVHESYLSRFHGGSDLVYPEAFKWKTVSELYEFLQRLTPDKLAQQALLARRHYEQYYSINHLNKALSGAVDLTPLPLGAYTPNLLQRYLDQERYIAEEVAAPREGQIASLNQALAEREGQIASLNQALAEREEQIAQILSSKSWRWTKPLRDFRGSFSAGLPNIVRRNISDQSRIVWRSLPLSVYRKQKLKSYLFSRLPFLFSWSNAYQTWKIWNGAYDDSSGTDLSKLEQSFFTNATYIPLLQATPLKSKPARVICFYLPQYHPIPENDAWWGEGFTEWTNVQPAMPQFAGHYQPRVHGELGYYNLLNPAVQRRQVELAKLYGIGGFCFYFYWFGGKRLLEKPIENYLNDRRLDLPFCLCWANENWSRRWDGLDSEILIAQQHSPEDDVAFIRYVSRYMCDTRYIRIGGKPLLLVYRPSLLASAKETAQRWRGWCRDNGVGEIYLAYTQSFETLDPSQYGFDAAIEFPPNNSVLPNITNTVTSPERRFRGVAYDWRVLAARSEKYQHPQYRLFRGVCPAWDNTARRKNRSTVFLHSTPSLYKRWLKNAIQDTEKRFATQDERLIFVNAWNEWAEGAYLEPDARYGYAYLQATRNALSGDKDGLNEEGRKIVLVAHDAYPHGAQLLSFNLAKTLRHGFGFHVDMICLGDGPLKTEYAKWATVHDLARVDVRGPEAIALARRLYEEGHRAALVNTTASGYFLETLATNGIKCIALIHELRGVLDQLSLHGHAKSIATHATRIVFAAEEVATSFKEVASADVSKFVIRPQGLYKRRSKLSDRAADRKNLRQKLGLPQDTQIVLGVGYADRRKGIDLFVEAGLKMAQRVPHARWVWIGHWEETMSREVGEKLSEFPEKKDRFIFPGLQSDTDLFYGGADVFALTSREDPFPSVVLEALDAEVPVVGFEGAGGFIGLLKEGCGQLVAKEDAAAFADAISHILTTSHEREMLGLHGAKVINERFSFRHYVYDLLDLVGIEMKRVSVVVPSFNYAHYLQERISSITAQRYPVFEIIFLDDCSNDHSVKVARDILEAQSIDYKVIVNKENSGSVFSQWKRGVEQARGTHVWIAEADDSCSPAFLTEVVNGFEDPEVVLSYCESKQIDEDGQVLANNYLPYVADIDAKRWLTPFINGGREEVAEALSIKNTIPNVSGVVFERSRLNSILDDNIDLIRAYRVAGDWLVYILMLKRGKIAFSPAPLNQHRRHSLGVTIGNRNKTQLDEIQRVQALVAQEFEVPQEKVDAARKYIEHLSRQFGLGFSSTATEMLGKHSSGLVKPLKT
ncbi:MAG TPA: glycoside hydrolase family 99-like domain-containing protein [Nitrospira sp.]|nr:glycoside hydrolase family 99-like domain-containing protein [Nitrospira sp.]